MPFLAIDYTLDPFEARLVDGKLVKRSGKRVWKSVEENIS
jgi:hypothetical protein